MTAIRRAVDELETLRRLVYGSVFRRGVYNPRLEESIVDQFHRLYYDSSLFEGTWRDTRWLGVPVRKCPFDLWVYQEMIGELRPDLIVESGTAEGGGALFFASVCDLVGNGRIVSVDVEERPGRPVHERVRYLLGSSTSDEVAAELRAAAATAETVIVVLDSDHAKDHVLDEMRMYGPLVTRGSYLVVEDTNVNGHPVDPEFGPGPMEAVEEFLRDTHDFEVDRSREKFYLTFNPSGFLRKVR